MEGEPVEATGIADVGLGFAGLGHVVAAVVIDLLDEFGIFVEMAGVEGAGEEILKQDGVGDADGLGVVHRVAQGAVGDVVVAIELDLADLDGGAFLDLEGDADGGGWDGFIDGGDGGELVAML
jgi:hypothetical protein